MTTTWIDALNGLREAAHWIGTGEVPKQNELFAWMDANRADIEALHKEKSNTEICRLLELPDSRNAYFSMWASQSHGYLRYMKGAAKASGTNGVSGTDDFNSIVPVVIEAEPDSNVEQSRFYNERPKADLETIASQRDEFATTAQDYPERLEAPGEKYESLNQTPISKSKEAAAVETVPETNIPMARFSEHGIYFSPEDLRTLANKHSDGQSHVRNIWNALGELVWLRLKQSK